MLFDFDASKDTWYIPTELPLSAISAVSPLEKALLYVAYPPPKPPVILGPNITGTFTTHNHLPAYNGAFYSAGTNGVGLGYASTIPVLMLKMDASKCSAIYSKGETVQPSSLIFNYVIKY